MEDSCNNCLCNYCDYEIFGEKCIGCCCKGAYDCFTYTCDYFVARSEEVLE